MGLDDKVQLGKGTEKNGARKRDRLLAGVFEAWLAAIYLENGHRAAVGLVEKYLVPFFDEAALAQDSKQVLQVWAQRRDGRTPVYEVVETTGPDHARQFCIAVFIGEQEVGRSWGGSKAEASRNASSDAVDRLKIGGVT